MTINRRNSVGIEHIYAGQGLREMATGQYAADGWSDAKGRTGERQRELDAVSGHSPLCDAENARLELHLELVRRVLDLIQSNGKVIHHSRQHEPRWPASDMHTWWVRDQDPLRGTSSLEMRPAALRTRPLSFIASKAGLHERVKRAEETQSKASRRFKIRMRSRSVRESLRKRRPEPHNRPWQLRAWASARGIALVVPHRVTLCVAFSPLPAQVRPRRRLHSERRTHLRPQAVEDGARAMVRRHRSMHKLRVRRRGCPLASALALLLLPERCSHPGTERRAHREQATSNSHRLGRTERHVERFARCSALQLGSGL